MSYSMKEFLEVATNTPEEAVKSLRGDLGFTAEGLVKLIETDKEQCSIFFTELIGQPFDVSNAGHITLVLEAGIKDAKSIAETMQFCYKFVGGEDASKKKPKAKAKTARTRTAKEKGPSKPREKKDWNTMDVPFNEGGKQAVVFVAMKEFSGGAKKDFNEIALSALSKAGLEATEKNVGGIVAHTINDSRKRGWNTRVVEGNLICERGEFVAPTAEEKAAKAKAVADARAAKAKATADAKAAKAKAAAESVEPSTENSEPETVEATA